VKMVNSRPVVSVTTIGPDPTDPESSTFRDFMLDVDTLMTPGVFHRIVLQFDLTTSRMLDAWIDAHKATVTPSGPTPVSGQKFYPNQHSAFVLGAFHATGDYIRDVTFAGFKVTATTLYDPASNSPVRLDSQSDSDLRRYFGAESAWHAYYAGNPVSSDRIVDIHGRDSGGSVCDTMGVLIDAAHGDTFSSYTAGPIRDIGLVRGDAWYGRAISWGLCYHGDIRDCRLQGGSHGLGAFFLGANYPMTILDTMLIGHDAPLFLSMCSSARAERIYLEESYRCGVRVCFGGLTIRNISSPHHGTPDFGFCVRRGTLKLLGDTALDNETGGGTAGSRYADVYVTPLTTGLPLSAAVEIEVMDGTFCQASAAKIMLGGPAVGDPERGGVGFCSIKVDNLAINTNSPFRAAVRVLPGAAGLWADMGVHLAPGGGQEFTPYEGPPMIAPQLVNTGAWPTPFVALPTYSKPSG